MSDWDKSKLVSNKMPWTGGMLVVVAILLGVLIGLFDFSSVTYSRTSDDLKSGIENFLDSASQSSPAPTWPAQLDTATYDQLLLKLAHYQPVSETASSTGGAATTTEVASELVYASSTNVTITGRGWPVAAPYPQGGAILPFKRILAYYGNFYSTRMGILGELPPEQMVAKLLETKKVWEEADPTTPVLPAIQYIAMVAQAAAGADGMYRAAMPEEEIEKAYKLSQSISGILILDLQVGKSTIERELPQYRTYLERPDVHLAIDPEFSMKYGDAPGVAVGTYDAVDINYVIDYLAQIVREKKLPPKVLVVHRFTQNMVTNAIKIKPRPEVQVVMDMDGWGPKELKQGTYNRVVSPEPVQFTGVKLFYKNDLKPPSTSLLTPSEVLGLYPIPIYIQYQ